MFGSEIIEIALGLILVYLMLGLVCTAINELIAQLLNLRATTLAEGIRNILADPRANGLAKELYEHHLINAFCRDGGTPSYLPPHTFASALIDIVIRDKNSGQLQDIKSAVDKLQNQKVKEVLQIFIDKAQGDVREVEKEIERWFDDAADRISGWYKRKTQTIILAVALVVTGLTNADTIAIANTLARDPALRAALVAQAQEIARQASTESTGQDAQAGRAQPPGEAAASGVTAIGANLEEIQKLGLPIGWVGGLPSGWDWVSKISGLLLTAFAASLGAPFWFDLLNKIINIRAVGKSPREPHKR